jgi:glycosyltransferase involved in cell wall biosynthesis
MMTSEKDDRLAEGGTNQCPVPLISVLMSLHNGEETVERAMSSLLQQGFPYWELLAVDARSKDSTAERLKLWAQRDKRIRPIFSRECRGPGAARNLGLRHAGGPMITYLDCDSEYHPDYLEQVARSHDQADVLVFRYQCLADSANGYTGRDGTWDPALLQGDLFWLGGEVVAPLGVAHSRELALRVGGFDENLWWDVDGDLLKRMARAGGSFIYLQSSSGRYHICEGTRSRSLVALPHQRARAERNFQAGNALYEKSVRGPGENGRPRKIVFASGHSVLDFSSGAAVASMDLLQGLAASGFLCQAFCSPKLDFDHDVPLEEMVAKLGEPCEVCPSVSGANAARVLYTQRGPVRVTIVRLDSTIHPAQSQEEVATVLQFFREFLANCRPDVMLTYGWDAITQGMIALAKRQDIPVVFSIHNFAYTELTPFWKVDYCIVPSEFARRHYWETLGLACKALPNPVDWDRVFAPDRAPRYVTFVNPCREKGVYVFARIADELRRRRPDVPLLVVESRGTRGTLAACGIDHSGHPNLQFMPNTPDPRQFWAVTRVALMPSLWWENQPAVAYEAMINGIPVIASDRGGNPEALGESGFLLSLPDRLTSERDTLPEAKEVEPWVETIMRLWDDRALYARKSAQARKEAERWHPARLRPLHAQFFRSVHPQPGPPFLPRVAQEPNLLR